MFVCATCQEKIRKEVMEFYFESWEVGMFKKSQGKLMSAVTKIFLIQQTFFFTEETVLLMSCDDHTQ